MADSKQGTEYTDVLDTIYQVTFGEAGKKKREKDGGKGYTPPDALGGLSTVSDSLLASLAALGVGAGGLIGSTIHESLDFFKLENTAIYQDMEFIDVTEDKTAPQQSASAGRLRVRTTEAKKFLQNPEEFVKGVFKNVSQQRRKFLITSLIGSRLDAGVAYTIGREIGLNKKEAQDLAFAASYKGGLGSSAPSQRAESRSVIKMQARGAVSESLLDRARQQGASISTNEIDKYANMVYAALSGEKVESLDPRFSRALGSLSQDARKRLVTAGDYRKIFEDGGEKSTLVSLLRKAGVDQGLATSIVDKYSEKLKAIKRIDTGGDKIPREIRGIEPTPGLVRKLKISSNEAELRALTVAYETASPREKRKIEGRIRKLGAESAIMEMWQEVRGSDEDYAFSFTKLVQRMEDERSRAVANLQSIINDPSASTRVKREATKALQEYDKGIRDVVKLREEYLKDKPYSTEGLALLEGRVPPAPDYTFTPESDARAWQAKRRNLEVRATALKAQVLAETDPTKKSLLQQQLLALQSAVEASDYLKPTAWRRRITDIQIAGSMVFDSVTGKGSLLPFNMLLNGQALFALNHSPAVMGPVFQETKNRNLHDYLTAMSKKEADPGIKTRIFVLPKDAGGGRILDRFRKTAAGMYYLTPAGIARTVLWDGAYFRYRQELARREMAKQFKNWIISSQEGQNRLKQIFTQMFTANKNAFKFLGFTDLASIQEASVDGMIRMASGNINMIVNELIEEPDFASDMQWFHNFIHRGDYAKWDRLGHAFSMPKRFYDATVGKVIGQIQKKIVKPFIKNLQSIYGSLAKVFHKSHTLSTFFGGLASGTGLNIVVQSTVNVILQSLGVSLGTALGGVLGFIITSVIMKAVEIIASKLIGALVRVGQGLVTVVSIPFLTLFILSAFAIGSMVSFLFGGGENINQQMEYVQTPTVTLTNVDARGGNPLTDDLGPLDGGSYSDGTRGSENRGTPPIEWEDGYDNYTCQIKSRGDFYCTQSSTPLCSQWSHYRLPGIDFVSYSSAYAPTDLIVTYVENDLSFTGPYNNGRVCGHRIEACDGEVSIVNGQYLCTGNLFRWWHATPASTVRPGALILRDEVIATQMDYGLPSEDNPCWTGAHYHFDIRRMNNGSFVGYYDAEDWMRNVCGDDMIGSCPKGSANCGR